MMKPIYRGMALCLLLSGVLVLASTSLHAAFGLPRLLPNLSFVIAYFGGMFGMFAGALLLVLSTRR